MTLEVDIMIGQTMSHIKGHEPSDKTTGKEEIVEDSQYRKPFKMDKVDVDISCMESNLFKLMNLEDKIVTFISVFSDRCEELNEAETLMEESRLKHMEKFERFGLQLFKPDHLHQYLDFLKGLQKEMEIGDFYDAKQHYIDSLINRASVNHRIRKEALLRLMFINKRIPK